MPQYAKFTDKSVAVHGRMSHSTKLLYTQAIIPHRQCDHVQGPYSQRSKVKVGVLRPVQQPGSYWDRSSELPLVGLEPTEVTAYD